MLKWFKLCVPIVVLTLGAVLSVAVKATAADSIKLKVATFAPPQAFLTKQIMVPWLEDVVAHSEGTLSYKLFPGGVLGRSPAQQLKLVQDGVADLALVVPDYTPGVFTSWSVVGIPGMFETSKEAGVALHRALETEVINKPQGVVVLGVFSSGINYIHAKQPYEGLDGLSGQRIRVVGKAQAAAVDRFGGVAVSNIRAPQVAEALSRNIVDATVMDYLGLHGLRVKEVANAHIDLPMGAVALIHVMNEDVWVALPEPAKRAFQKYGGEAFSLNAGTLFAKGIGRARGALEKRQGESFLKVDAEVRASFDSKIWDVHEAWINGDDHLRTVHAEFERILSDVRAGR